jgi:predicted transport protein
VMVAAGKKAALTRATASYSVDEYFDGKPERVRHLGQTIREFITGLDTAIEETPKKFYIAYKISQNIVCMQLGKQRVTLFLKLDPRSIPDSAPNVRDVTHIGHYGTGDVEVSIESEADFFTARPLIEKAYRNVGG